MDTLSIICLVSGTLALLAFPSAGDDISPGLSVGQGEPLEVITQKSEALFLNCTIVFNESLGPISITWTKDGDPLDIGSRIQVLENGTLVIRRIKHRPRRGHSDEGRYVCRATLGNVGTIIVREVQVLVAGIERKFTLEPQPQAVPLGGVARFQCKIRATPPPLYVWEKNQSKLPQNDNRYLFLSSGILQITGVTASDVGDYRCYATQGSLNDLSGLVSDIEGRYSNEASLTIASGPVDHQIIASSDNVTVNVGVRAVLECLIQGPQIVEWTREVGTVQERVPISQNGRISLLGTNLMIHATELKDNGKYLCKAGNHIKVMVLNVIKAPVLTKIPPSSRNPAGQWVYSQCLAEGSPNPEITYLFNGEPIKFGNEYKLTKVSDRFVGEVMAIVLSDQNHSGFYQCRASNSAGTVYGFFRVEFFYQKNAPDIPVNLRAINITSTSARVVWDPPIPLKDYDLKILAYTVKYRKTDDSTIMDTVSESQQVDLNNLEPFTQYTLFIQAYSQAGAGHKSSELIFTTQESVPRRPVEVYLEPRARSIMVKWSHLNIEDRQGIITHYKLFYRQQEMGSTLKVVPDIPANATSYIIGGLQTETSYEVRMLAGTSMGTGSFSDQNWPWVSVHTREKDYVTKPVLHVVPLNQTVVNATWSFYGDVEIEQYRLELLPLGALLGNRPQTWTLASDMHHQLIHNLDENTFYEISLTAILKDGSMSSVVEEYSASTAPHTPYPRNLQVTLRTATSLSVSWYQLEPTEWQIVQYIVRYAESAGQTVPLNYQTVVSKTTSALLQNLKPGTMYEIAVQSETEEDHSKFSPSILVATGASSEPQDLRAQAQKPGFVRLDWQPPAVATSSIKSYRILYTTQPNDPDEKWKMVTKNGSELSAVISLGDERDKLYYFKILALTDSGPGQVTRPIEYDGNMAAITDPEERKAGLSNEQELGIIIGVSICAAFIIICVVIFLLRNRLFSSAYQQQQMATPQAPRYHSNGHIPGNGNGHALMSTESSAPVTSAYEMTPMLNKLQENEDSDSKGGGTGNLILTPNGAKLNGFVPLKKNGYRNGETHNGHLKFLRQNYMQPLDAEQTRGLIDAMMGGSGDHIEPIVHHTDNINANSRYSNDMASLEDIDHIQVDAIVSPVRSDEVVNRTNGDDSGAGSLTDSCDGGRGSPGSHQSHRRHYQLDDGIHDYSPPSDLDTGSAESCRLSDVGVPVEVEIVETQDNRDDIGDSGVGCEEDRNSRSAGCVIVNGVGDNIDAMNAVCQSGTETSSVVCRCGARNGTTVDCCCLANASMEPQPLSPPHTSASVSNCLKIPPKQQPTSVYSQANDATGVIPVTPVSNKNCRSDNRVPNPSSEPLVVSNSDCDGNLGPHENFGCNRDCLNGGFGLSAVGIKPGETTLRNGTIQHLCNGDNFTTSSSSSSPSPLLVEQSSDLGITSPSGGNNNNLPHSSSHNGIGGDGGVAGIGHATETPEYIRSSSSSRQPHLFCKGERTILPQGNHGVKVDEAAIASTVSTDRVNPTIPHNTLASGGDKSGCLNRQYVAPVPLSLTMGVASLSDRENCSHVDSRFAVLPQDAVLSTANTFSTTPHYNV